MQVSHSEQMIDVASPDHECEVTIEAGAGGISVWVNVDGVCRLRVCHLDPRKLTVNYRLAEIIDAIANRNTP